MYVPGTNSLSSSIFDPVHEKVLKTTKIWALCVSRNASDDDNVYALSIPHEKLHLSAL